MIFFSNRQTIYTLHLRPSRILLLFGALQKSLLKPKWWLLGQMETIVKRFWDPSSFTLPEGRSVVSWCFVVEMSLRQTWSSSWDKVWWDAFGQTWISMFELAKMQAHVGYFWLLCCLRVADSCLVCQQCCQITGQRVPTFLRRLFPLLQFHQINVKTSLVSAQSHRSRTGGIGLSVVVTKPHDREGGRYGVCLW